MVVETEQLELKKSLSQLKEGVISLSAMLNKHGKGTVYFGVNDEGVNVGVAIGKKTKADIIHEIQNNLKPLPNSVDINEEIVEDKTILKVLVSGNDTPYSAYGRYYVRANDSDIQMNSYQLQNYFQEKEDTYSRWENEETDYDASDINEDQLIECIRTANDKGRMDYVYRNSYEALSKLGLLSDNGKLNNAGLYLFGSSKPITIKEANYPTDTRDEFGEIKEFKGNIFDCIKESASYIQNHISFKSNIVGLQREEVPEIPLRAIREIVINSFAHCSYARKGDFNQYVIYKSSVRIYNPGSIIRGIDPIKFASGKIGSKIRNPLIASTLYKCGYIDAFGTGFDRTFSLCSQNDVEYKYEENEFGFTFIFKRKTNYLNDKINDKINKLDKDIISLLKENKYITIPELSKDLGKSEPTIYRHLEQLINNSFLKRIGSRKTGYWELIGGQ